MTAQIPLKFIDENTKHHLAYAYFLDTDGGYTYECNLLKNCQLRIISFKSETIEETRLNGLSKLVLEKKMDGIIDFGYQTANLMDLMKSLKTYFIGNLLPKSLFEPSTANETRESNEDLKTIFAIHETLLKVDFSFKHFFEDVRFCFFRIY